MKTKLAHVDYQVLSFITVLCSVIKDKSIIILFHFRIAKMKENNDCVNLPIST